jgi:anaerobic selenocysteine-containing dehydrogenase
MKKVTICRLCSACCPVEAEIADGRLIAVRRESSLPPAQQLPCPKLQAAVDITYAPDRLTRPLIKDGAGHFREAGWDEALDAVASRMQHSKQRHGAQSVAWLRGMAADWGAPWDYASRLMHAFGSPNAIGNGSVCHVAREMAHTFVYGAMTMPQPNDAKCILVWGKNDRNTCPPAFEAIVQGRQKGARLIVIDPVRTPLAEMADLWLQIKPGHDGLLAMAMIHTIIGEELYDREFVDRWCSGFDALGRIAQEFSPESVAGGMWLEAVDIREAARMYATAAPACIVDGNGLDMQLQVFDATRAIGILRALTGNLDRPGGDLMPQPVPARNLQLKDRLPAAIPPVTCDYPLFSGFHHNWGLHAQSTLIDAILDERPYPVRMLIVQSGNPAVTMTDSRRVQQALQKLDCLVAIDLFPTRTTALADIVLPAAGCFEKTQLNRAALRHSLVCLQDQIIDCVGDSWPDWKITFELARRLDLGGDFPWQTVEQAIDYQLEPAGITTAGLRNRPGGIRAVQTGFEKYRETGFKTPSGKVELASPRLAQNGLPAVPFEKGFDASLSFTDRREEYPFIGISGERSNRYTHSQFRQIPALRRQEPEAFIDMHPDDASRLGVDNGHLLQVSTPVGRIRMKARISDVVHVGSVLIAWGWGEVDPALSLNNLTDDRCRNPVTATPSNRSFMCKVENLGAPSAPDA